MGRVAPLCRNSPLPILGQRHPRAPHRLRADQLPKLGSALPGYSPSTPTWQAGAPGPFPRVTRAHYAIPAPHGPLAYRGRLARCLGYPLSDTHRSQPRSQPVNRAPAPLQAGSSLHSHQQQNDFHFINLTNPATHFTLTPESLGRESLLPPITHRTMHSTITPNTQTRWPHSLNMPPFLNSSTHTPLTPSIL